MFTPIEERLAPGAKAKLVEQALLFHLQSEHFDRTVPHVRNKRGVAIPTGPERRQCELNAERLLTSMYEESIKHHFPIRFHEWVQFTKEQTQLFESLLHRGWMDRYICVTHPELTWFPRDYSPNLAALKHPGGTVTHYHSTGKYLIVGDVCAEIFEPRIERTLNLIDDSPIPNES